jgi:hypothetical protein
MALFWIVMDFHMNLWTCSTLCGNFFYVAKVFHLSFEPVAVYVVVFYTIREFHLSLWTCNVLCNFVEIKDYILIWNFRNLCNFLTFQGFSFEFMDLS